ncbi:MAG TPA: pimeloyl-[acyl-carrier protein] methyl ester esterase [Sedimenticola sp.]|nr:pimeloyl-[acyl-carrier protein] methyl ester esterase [Sedimenticola sp.]
MKLWTRTLGAGPALVLLHGWGMNAGVWEAVLPRLSRRFRVTVIELPGHGGSGYDPRAATLSAWAEACLAAAPAHAAWVGWSLGGQIAIQCALQAPARVRRLLLVASTPCFAQRAGWPHAMDPQTLALFTRVLKRNPRQTLARFLSLQVQGDEALRVTLRTLRQAMTSRPEPLPEALGQGLDLLNRVDLRDDLSRLRCPLNWLLGEQDALIPAAVAEDLAALPGAGVTLLPGAAHVPFVSHPEPCAEWLEANR